MLASSGDFMIRIKTVRSIFLLLLGAFSGAAFSFLSQLYLARQLGPSAFGVYAAAVSAVMIVAPIAGFGIQGFWLNVFGEEGWRAIRWLPSSYKYIALTFFLAFLIIFSWAIVGPNSRTQSWILVALSLHAVGQMSIEIVDRKFQLEERYTSVALMQSLPHGVRLCAVLSVPFFFAEVDPIKFSVAYAFVGASLVLWSAFEIRLMQSLRFNLKGHGVAFFSEKKVQSTPNVLDLYRRAWPYGSAGILYFIHFQIASALLVYLSQPTEAGLYNAGMLVMNAVFILPGVLYQKFLLPKQHRWAQQDRAMFVRVFKLGNKLMFFFGVIFAILLWISVPYLMPTFFGNQFSGVEVVLSILIFGVPVRFVATSVGSVLVSGPNMKVKIFCMGI